MNKKLTANFLKELTRRQKVALLTVLTIGLTVHMLMPFLDGERLPSVIGHFSDQIQFDEEAHNLQTGNGISNTELGELKLATATYPAYIIFITGVRILLPGDYLAIFIMQHLLIIISAVICFSISLKKGLGFVAGLISLCFVLFYPPFLKIPNLLLPTSLAVFLTVLCCYILARKPTYLNAVTVGIVCGILTLTRFTFQFFLPLYVLIYVCWLRRDTIRFSQRIKWGLISLVAFLITLAPWYIHIAEIEGEFTPGSTRSWMMVYRFNQPSGDSKDSLYTRLESSELSFSERDSIYRSRALENLLEHPEGYARNIMYNIPVLFLNIGNGVPSLRTTYSAIIGAFALFLIIIASVKLRRKLLKEFTPEMLFALILLTVHLPIYGTPIHSLPVWAVLSPLIGVGFVYTITRKENSFTNNSLISN